MSESAAIAPSDLIATILVIENFNPKRNDRNTLQRGEQPGTISQPADHDISLVNDNDGKSAYV